MDSERAGKKLNFVLSEDQSNNFKATAISAVSKI